MYSPLSSNETCKKKFSNLDSLRIFKTVDEFILRIEILSFLTSALEHMDRISIDLGSQLRSQMISFRQLIHLVGNGPLLEDIELRSIEIIHSIIRSFGVNPSAFSSLKKRFHKQQSVALGDFIKFFRDFRSILLDYVLASRKDNFIRDRYLESLVISLHRLNLDIKSLNGTVQNSISKRDEELGKKNIQLKSLKAEMDTLQRINHEDMQLMLNESLKQREQTNNAHIDLHQQLLKQKVKLIGESEVKFVKNRQTETFLREKKERIEQEVDNWILRYDRDMEDKQNQIDLLVEHCEQHNSDLEILERKLFILESDYLAVVIERNCERDRQDEKDKQLRLQTDSVVKLQYYWRRYQKIHPRRSKLKRAKAKGRNKK